MRSTGTPMHAPSRMMAPTLPAISGSKRAMRMAARLGCEGRDGNRRWTREGITSSMASRGTAMLIALLIPLVLAITVYAIVLVRAVIARKILPSGEGVILGAVTNFFDTLGIGSFAPTMAW